MIEITTPTVFAKSIGIVDRRIRELITSALDGVSGGGFGLIAKLYDSATQQQQDDVQSIIDNLDVLDIAATKTTIIADGVDSTVITCAALGAAFDYVIYLNSAFEQSGSVTDGGIDFTAIEAGVYTIEIRSQSTFETGFVEITGVESA